MGFGGWRFGKFRVCIAPVLIIKGAQQTLEGAYDKPLSF